MQTNLLIFIVAMGISAVVAIAVLVGTVLLVAKSMRRHEELRRRNTAWRAAGLTGAVGFGSFAASDGINASTWDHGAHQFGSAGTDFGNGSSCGGGGSSCGGGGSSCGGGGSSCGGGGGCGGGS